MDDMTSSVSVDRGQDAVFDYLVDPSNQVQWSPNFLELVRPPAGPVGLGSTFQGKLKNFGTLEFVYDEFTPRRSFRMAADHRLGHMSHRFTVDGDSKSATVSHAVAFEPKGLGRLGAPLMKPMLKRMITDLDLQLKSCLRRLPGPAD